MRQSEIEEILSELHDPTTPRMLAEALGYACSTPISSAARQNRIPGARKLGGVWLLSVDGVREAIRQKTLRPGWRHGRWDPPR
jgi:hypothetical protein